MILSEAMKSIQNGNFLGSGMDGDLLFLSGKCKNLLFHGQRHAKHLL